MLILSLSLRRKTFLLLSDAHLIISQVTVQFSINRFTEDILRATNITSLKGALKRKPVANRSENRRTNENTEKPYFLYSKRGNVLTTDLYNYSLVSESVANSEHWKLLNLSATCFPAAVMLSINTCK